MPSGSGTEANDRHASSDLIECSNEVFHNYCQLPHHSEHAFIPLATRFERLEINSFALSDTCTYISVGISKNECEIANQLITTRCTVSACKIDPIDRPNRRVNCPVQSSGQAAQASTPAALQLRVILTTSPHLDGQAPDSRDPEPHADQSPAAQSRHGSWLVRCFPPHINSLPPPTLHPLSFSPLQHRQAQHPPRFTRLVQVSLLQHHQVRPRSPDVN